MMTRKTWLTIAAAVLASVGLEARTFEVSAWRGETVAALVENFAELRNGIVAAEKMRLLKELGLGTEDLAKLSALYKVAEATANKSDFVKIRAETIKVVNRP